MQIKKIQLSDSNEVRRKILSGVKKMNDLVSPTLGPNGLSVLIERGMGEPLLIDDGRRTAEEVKLDDPIEHLIARVLYGITRKTDEKAGDGTTTSMILAHAIIDEVYKKYLPISDGGMELKTASSVADIDAQIQKSKDNILKQLEEKKKEIKTEKDLIDVASCVVNDPELGKVIGGMYWQLGKNGHITLEFNLLTPTIETEIVPGYRFTGGYAATWMITDAIKKNAVLKDIDVLVAHRKDLDIDMIQPVCQELASAGKNRLLIISPRFTDDFLKGVYKTATRERNNFLVMCVRAPGRQEEAYKDMAIFTGGKYFCDKDDMRLATKKDLGFVEEASIEEDITILVNGRGKKEEVDKRVKEVQAEADAQKLPQFKNDRLERVSALSFGAGVIHIGAPTDDERNWLKYKIEDAKYAVKHAFRDGIVKGGGLTYKEISDKLSDDDILKEPLLAPYKKLKENGGKDFKVGKNVFDPVTVERWAIENACSAASKIIRIGGCVAWQRSKFSDELAELIQAKHNE